MSESLGVHESIYGQGFVPVGIDLGRSDLETAMQHYLAFLELDESMHEITRFFTTDRGDGDFGQFRRTAGEQHHMGRGALEDNKDIFHFGSQSRQVIEARLNGALPRDMKDFLDAAEEIFWAAQRTKAQVINELDWTQSGLIGILTPEQGTINDVLRFLAYYPNDGKLAKGHFDRDAMTVAIGESHEGLRLTRGQNGLVVDCDEAYMADLEARLRPVEHHSGEAKFFLGAGWNRLPNGFREGNHDLELGWHDVVESDQTVNDKVMRWAIVQFCNPCLELSDYVVPTPPETRPHKQLGRLSTEGALVVSGSAS